MAKMTDEEYDRLADLFAKEPPKVLGNGQDGPLITRGNKTLVFKNPDGTITIVPPRANDTTTLITFDPENLASITTKTHTIKQPTIKTAKKTIKKRLALA